MEGCAGLVGQRHPALHVDRSLFLIEQGDVVGAPAEARREVADRCGPRSGAGAVHGHRQGRPRAQIGRHAVEDRPHRKPVVAQHFDTIADLDHDAARCGEDCRSLARFGARCRIGADKGDGLADGLFHQLGGGQQVEVEILLDDPCSGSSEAERFGTDAGGDVGKLDPAAPSGDRQLAHILNQRLSVVVDGDRNIALCGRIGVRQRLFRGLGQQRSAAENCQSRQCRNRIRLHRSPLTAARGARLLRRPSWPVLQVPLIPCRLFAVR